MSEKKTVYRIVPCAGFDVEGMQSWLEEQAQKGLMLTRDGFMLGFGIFERGEPQSVRYRLDTRREKRGLLDANSDRPDEELTESYESFGWEYVASRARFHIFRTADPMARELNTDPAVQAAAINALRRSELINALLIMLWLILGPWQKLFTTPVLSAVSLGTPLALLSAAVFAALLALVVSGSIYLSKFRKRLVGKAKPEKPAVVRKRRIRRTVCIAITLALSIVYIIAIASKADRELLGKDGTVHLDEYSGAVPFATIIDLSEGVYIRSRIQSTNTVRVWHDALAPQAVEWNEAAHITREDGTTLSAGLRIEYYELSSPRLAREAARELEQAARKDEIYTLPALDADYAAAYMDHTFFRLILQKGTAAMRILFYQTSSDYELPLDEFAALMAKSIG